MKKNIFSPKMAPKNALKKCGVHLLKSNFKVQDTTKKCFTKKAAK